MNQGASKKLCRRSLRSHSHINKDSSEENHHKNNYEAAEVGGPLEEGLDHAMNQGASKKLCRRSLRSHSHINKDSSEQNHHKNNYEAAEVGGPLEEGLDHTMNQGASKKLCRRSLRSHSHINKDSSEQNHHKNNYEAAEVGGPLEEGLDHTMNQGASKKKLRRRSLRSHSHINKDSSEQNHHKNNYEAAEVGGSLEEGLDHTMNQGASKKLCRRSLRSHSHINKDSSEQNHHKNNYEAAEVGGPLEEGLDHTMNQGASKKKLCRRSLRSHSHINKDSSEQNHHKSNYEAAEVGGPLEVKDFASLQTTTETPPSSFEFYVWSDEGISLHVNLNSSPSDWTKRFTKEVCITENLLGKESWSFWQDHGCLGESSTQRKSFFLQNTKSSQIKICRRQNKTPPSLKLAKDVTGLDKQDKADCSLITYPVKSLGMPGNAEDNLKDNRSIVSAELGANMADNLKEGQSTVSAEQSYGEPNNFISGAESCAKDESKGILDSDVADTPFIKSISGSFGNFLLDHGKLECQNSKPGNDISEDFTLPNGSCFINPGEVCPGVSVGSSVGLQISEVASCHKYASVSLCENDRTLDLIYSRNIPETENGGLVNSSKFNLDTDGNNFLSLTEEWEVRKIATGRESSECSQFDGPPKLCDPESDDRDSEVQGFSDKPFTMILRSMVQPRRSKRLISKRI